MVRPSGIEPYEHCFNAQNEASLHIDGIWKDLEITIDRRGFSLEGVCAVNWLTVLVCQWHSSLSLFFWFERIGVIEGDVPHKLAPNKIYGKHVKIPGREQVSRVGPAFTIFYESPSNLIYSSLVDTLLYPSSLSSSPPRSD
jgi:hypothetical protein